jgi:hypothetical protein
MTDTRKDEAMTRLRAAAARVSQHEAERLELAAAIVEALNAGARPSEVDAEVPYDRNHIRRIAKAAGVPARRDTTVMPIPRPLDHERSPRSSA